MTHLRRSHKKSRNGCIQCKRRRVKCDETGPPCSSCSIRELDCTYPTAIGDQQRLSSATLPSTNQGMGGPHQHRDSPSVQNYHNEPSSKPQDMVFPPRLQELYLVHHYSTTTCNTLCRDQVVDLGIWINAVPTIARRYDFLMDGILALASLHIALEDPEKRQPFTTYALSYHNRALQQFSDALASINPDNCDALFAFALITALLSFAFCDSRISAVSRTPFENVLFISRLLRGLGTLVDNHEKWLRDGKLKGLFIYTPYSGTPNRRSGEAMHSARQAIFESIAGMAEDERGVYEAAVGILDACHGVDSNSVNIEGLVTFPVMIHERIITDICDSRHSALQVLLYYGMLMSQLEDRWWARMFGKQLVNDINSHMTTAHGDRSPAI